MTRKLLLLTFALVTACAPATTATGPAPVPPPRTETPPPAAEPAQPVVDPSGAPAQWWLMSTDAAGAYGANVDRAYRELLAGKAPQRTVVVAVIDSGIDIGHDDLDGNLWVNEDEVAGNGRDDDNNGYIDDLHGWNFIGGPNGRHVGQDTYEVTRLYAQCRMRETGGQPAYAPSAAECATIEEDFQERVQENQQMLGQIRNMNQAVTEFVRLLKQETRSDTLTVAKVEALRPMRNDVMMAQRAYLQLAKQGITPQMIADEEQRIEDLLAHGLNPEFDPRSIVGDVYTNPNQRGYGNADVTGPDAGHGTGVAGIIAAERGNGLGEDGIANAVKIMVLRAVPDGDERDKDVANAIRYAVDNGAHVINMSFGKSYSPYKETVDAAVKYAVDRGVLLVHAAGNDGANLAEAGNFPTPVYRGGGEAETWLEVGASGWQGADRLAADFSNYGANQVDLFAPGVDIHTTDVEEAFQTNSGTSFAAPVVSGVAALIMSYYPQLTAREVRSVLIESATPLREIMVVRPGTEGEKIRFGELSRSGALVNAYEALKLAEKMAAGKPKT